MKDLSHCNQDRFLSERLKTRGRGLRADCRTPRAGGQGRTLPLLLVLTVAMNFSFRLENSFMRFRASFLVTTARGGRSILISPMALAFRIASSVRSLSISITDVNRIGCYSHQLKTCRKPKTLIHSNEGEPHTPGYPFARILLACARPAASTHCLLHSSIQEISLPELSPTCQ